MSQYELWSIEAVLFLRHLNFSSDSYPLIKIPFRDLFCLFFWEIQKSTYSLVWLERL